MEGKAVSHSENLQTIQSIQQSMLKAILLRVAGLHGGTAGMGFFSFYIVYIVLSVDSNLFAFRI